MNRYKLVDKETKKQKGILKCDLEKLKKELRPRIIAGVCCTLIVGSTLGVFYEAVDNAKDTVEEANAKHMISQVVDSSLDLSHIRLENEVQDEIDGRVEYLEEVFNGFDNDDLVNYPVITKLSDDFKEIINDSINASGEKYRTSELTNVRDELRNICDSVKDLLEKMNKLNHKNEEEDKKNKDDKEVYPFGDKKTDIFYKESLDTGRRL